LNKLYKNNFFYYKLIIHLQKDFTNNNFGGKYMPKITEIIKKRISCRTYSERPIEDKVLKEFSASINAVHTGPFGNQPKFNLIKLTSLPPQEWKKLGTYGVIKNAPFFLVGRIQNNHLALEDYGYCKEKLILQATKLGLGTCWLGGTFQISRFAQAIDLQEGELLPTVSPVGYPAQQKSFTERMMRWGAGSDNRKFWSDIFFAGNFSQPLTQAQAGKYSEALENVRLAPSAGNKQPWRILRDAKLNAFHFYLSRAFGYNLMRNVSLQDIDLGIAICHFALTVQETGLTGRWQIDAAAPKEKSLDYIVTWQDEN
jgi:nitroreductase